MVKKSDLYIWERLPEEYRYEDPYEEIVAWRGDIAGAMPAGMHSRLDRDVSVDDHFYGRSGAKVLEAALAGYDDLFELVRTHTHNAEEDSPLISMTNDLRLAQLFAEEGSESTLYKVSIPAIQVNEKRTSHT